ncbi:MAG: aminopeptidase N [Pseudonocardiales bacterium]|nr:aminopeptidase N [Pseudonocardiales bacterium]MBV9032028.1 aminopeptidase N [Pseudonocardiales bacterium]
MAVPNLTQEQALERAALLDVDSYTVDLDLTDGGGRPGEGTFHSTTTVRFSCRTPGASSWIDVVAARVSAATLNGAALDIAGYDEANGITLPALAADNEVIIEAEGRYMNTGEGLHRFVDPVDGGVYLYSQFETADAKRMYACFDQPDLKAVHRLRVVAPTEWVVVSNAPCRRTEALAGGATRHVFADSARISPYIVALVAGPYARWADEYTDDEGTVPLGIYCRSSLAEHMDAERLFTETKQGFGFYHRAFGMHYPFEKYDQCFVPEFNAGAMENAGCVTFREDYVFRSRVTRYLYERRAETVLHEMAHMWFGDLVTMRWWDDLWLNESFATWASVLCQARATEYTGAWTTFATVEKAWAYRQDQLPSTHPIACDIPDVQAVEVNFDGITYAKGASVLRQLVAYVGLEEFLAGLRIYFTRHAWANATLADLLAALEQASGRDLSGWSAQWLETTGLNTLRPEFTVDGDGAFTSFAVLQAGAHPGAGERRTHRLAVGVYDSPAAGPLVRTHRVELDVTEERTEVPELVGVPAGQLVLVNDDDLTYCAMRLDERSLATLVRRIGDIAESLPRSLCWSAAWEMTREAEFRARDFVAVVLGGLPAETEVGVVQRLLAQAQTALSAYADPAWASEEGWPRFTSTLMNLLSTADPGSDHQLALVNALTAALLSKPELDAMAGWLAGDGVPEALVVDTDLRWRLLQALTAHGVTGEDEIAAEQERDATATGRRQAERTRALLPTPAAKERAWQRATRDDELPNAISEAIIGGFSHPTQRQLLAPYLDRYFAEIADVWDRRTSERAQSCVLGLFPSWVLEQRCVDAASTWLESGEHPPALRRLVSEGQAGVVRALAARAFDAGGS